MLRLLLFVLLVLHFEILKLQLEPGLKNKFALLHLGIRSHFKTVSSVRPTICILKTAYSGILASCWTRNSTKFPVFAEWKVS